MKRLQLEKKVNVKQSCWFILFCSEGVLLGPPVIWAVNKSQYRMGTGKDGLPVFYARGYNYQAIVAGTGSISWYIFCERRQGRRFCPVQGVCHADGRLLMLRIHNHLPQVMFDQAGVSLNKRIARSVQEKRNLDALMKKRWDVHILPENLITASSLTNLCLVVKNRWKAARRESFLTKLRENIQK